MSARKMTKPPGRWLPLRFALRELRGGLHGFYVFIVCIALGSMAIAGVGSLAASLAYGLAREGRVILGGDLAFTLIQREAAPNERAFLQAHGQVSSAATMRGMARAANGQATLVEMKAVDTAYPLFGQVNLDAPGALAEALAQRDGIFGAVADPTLMARLEVAPGARLSIGNATFEIHAALTSEPDKLAGGIGFGPRLLVSQDALRATGLLQPGSLVRWHDRLRLPANDASDTAA
jgi:putative ABC transport system permease protein